MNHGYQKAWPIVTQEQFKRVMQDFDYAREGWSDCIIYYDRTRQVKHTLGYEVDGPYNAELSRRDPPTFLLHPSLVSAPA